MSAATTVGIDATTWWNQRGFGRFTRELTRALAARGGEFRYTLVIDRPPDASLPAAAAVLAVPARRTTTAAGAGSGSRSPRDLWALARAVAAARFDLFFFPAVYSYFPLCGRPPCVVAFHDTIAERYPRLIFPTRRNHWLWAVKARLARRQAGRVMTVSAASARDLTTFLGVPPERIDLVSEAADPRFRPLADPAPAAAIRQRLGLPAAVPLFLYVGGLNRHKNLLGLLRGMEILLATHPEAWLAVVGDTSGEDFYGNFAELDRHVRERPPLAARVRFTGQLGDDDLVALYNAATALVLPSLWEGFGLPAVEAMACGVPVAASRRGSLPEVVGEAGLYFDPEVPAEIAAALARLLAEPGLRPRLAAAARERARGFTWERGAELAETSFRRCLEGRSWRRG